VPKRKLKGKILTVRRKEPSPIVSRRHKSAVVSNERLLLLTDVKFKVKTRWIAGPYWRATVDCLTIWIRVQRLVELRSEVGPKGRKAASDIAEDWKTRWKGIASLKQKILDAGMYS
jgi:hypothetical protein